MERKQKRKRGNIHKNKNYLNNIKNSETEFRNNVILYSLKSISNTISKEESESNSLILNLAFQRRLYNYRDNYLYRPKSRSKAS